MNVKTNAFHNFLLPTTNVIIQKNQKLLIDVYSVQIDVVNKKYFIFFSYKSCFFIRFAYTINAQHNFTANKLSASY